MYTLRLNFDMLHRGGDEMGSDFKNHGCKPEENLSDIVRFFRVLADDGER